MAYIVETLNVFEPLRATKSHVAAGTKIGDWVRKKFPATGEFPSPTICLFNGEALMRKDWGKKITDKDVVNFVAIPAGIEEIIIIVLVVATLAFTIVTVLNQPKAPGEQPGSDPVFSSKGQQNSIRLGEPIECSYGRNRIYPSLAARPYFQYSFNDQYQYSLFCIGQGEYEISAVQIGGTPIDSFQEVQYEILPPGTAPTLIPGAVYTAPEAGGQTLFAPNDPERTGDGWVGPFPACAPGTQTAKIQVDVSLPKGLYRMTKLGKPDTLEIDFRMESRLIDDLGAPLADWEVLGDDPFTAIVGTTTTPQRRSFIEELPLGRYEVRLRRESNAGLTAAFGDEIIWEALRGYLDVEQNFGDVTLLAVIIRATSNLNNQTQQRFNVIATRKLPIRESGGVWSEPTATRSIVWAFVDIFRSVYGGRIFDDTFFDWDALEALEALYEGRDEHFDWVFRDAITVWEAARTVALVGRAAPLLVGSLITMKRDGPLEVPVAMFNQENIVENTFEWGIKLWDLDEYDSAAIEYTDPDTGYKQETVTAVLPGGTSDHPEDIRFAGIQSRAHAYHEGMYGLASRIKRRENCTFETGLEGFIPTYGDLIAVVHDIPRWGQGGYVVHAERGGGDVYQLWVSEPLVWTADADHQISFRGRQGQLVGPLDVIKTDDPKQVVIHSTADIDFLLGGENEPMLFMFGIADEVTKLLRVVKVEPQGGESIRITGFTEEPEVHTFDDLIPPALLQPDLPPITPALPIVTNLKIKQIDAVLHIVSVSWNAAFGAQYYMIQTSEDNVFWHERSQTNRTSIQMQVFPGDFYVRVAGVNEGQGPWASEHATLGLILELTLLEPWEAEWAVGWQQVINATEYKIRVYDNSISGVPVLKRTTTQTDLRNFTYTFANAVSDGNVVREMLVTVATVIEDEEDTPTELELSNALPPPPTDLAAVIESEESDEVIYRFSWTVPEEADLYKVKVWVSDVDGFDPSVDVPVFEETGASVGFAYVTGNTAIAIALESDGTHPVKYYRVAVFDAWGDEISTNVSDQATLAAYP